MADTAVDLAVALAKPYELCRLKAYWDAAGKVWTVGWGCTGGNIDGTTVWTQDFADAELRRRMNAAHNQALALSPNLARESIQRQAAITDFIYNLGSGRYQHSTLHYCINKGDWAGAIVQIQLWDHADGEVNATLDERRCDEARWLGVA